MNVTRYDVTYYITAVGRDWYSNPCVKEERIPSFRIETDPIADIYARTLFLPSGIVDTSTFIWKFNDDVSEEVSCIESWFALYDGDMKNVTSMRIERSEVLYYENVEVDGGWTMRRSQSRTTIISELSDDDFDIYNDWANGGEG